jgi:hypothetical protein
MIHDATRLQQLEEIELATANFIKLEHGIIWIRYKHIEEEFSLKQAKTHTKAISKLSGGQPVHLIIDFRDLDFGFSNEARDYFAQDDTHSSFRLSQSLILSSIAHRIVGNFYLKFNKPNCPARIFAKPVDALEWIATLI